MKRVLVVDDDPQVLKVYSRIGEKTGHRFDTASSGMEGVSLLREHTYDLVFLDLHLPDMDGIDILRRVREMDPHVAVYILTGFYNRFMDRLKLAAEEGLKFEIFKKPMGIERIIGIVENILENNGYNCQDDS